MSNNTGSAAGGGGITVTGLLQVAFIVLKLCHVIDWSWFWVLFPTILGVSFMVVCLIIVLIISLVDTSRDGTPRRRRKKRVQGVQKKKEKRERKDGEEEWI